MCLDSTTQEMFSFIMSQGIKHEKCIFPVCDVTEKQSCHHQKNEE